MQFRRRMWYLRDWKNCWQLNNKTIKKSHRRESSPWSYPYHGCPPRVLASQRVNSQRALGILKFWFQKKLRTRFELATPSLPWKYSTCWAIGAWYTYELFLQVVLTIVKVYLLCKTISYESDYSSSLIWDQNASYYQNHSQRNASCVK